MATSAEPTQSSENPNHVSNRIIEDTITPELVFGLVGPIGVDMESVQNQLSNSLKAVGYNPVIIRVTDLMTAITVDEELDETGDPLRHYESRINYASAVRAECGSDAALAGLTILKIRRHRQNFRSSSTSASDLDAERPIEKTAYIVRQFKREEEINLLRKVYGRKFIQISIHLSNDERKKSLARKLAHANASLTPEQCVELAEKLIIRDLDERDKPHGQRITEVFHLGDVFVNAKTERTISETISRFIDALFGKNSISPKRDEYGAYIASSASLRSLDTSRQVGAAIFSDTGEIISLGCNEVPSAGGGTYWSDHPTPHRDFEEGGDANRAQKRRIAYDFIKRLFDEKELSSKEFNSEIFDKIISKDGMRSSLLNDITEFGRMTHAEMSALSDAARLGRSTKNAILFCTTFPCHNCAKHLIASGIKRVVFIEPYPKSQALMLHADAIVIDKEGDNRVLFEHFVGISPRRYRDIFEKGGRRGPDGKLREWYEGQPAPRIEDRGPAYVLNEASAAYSSLREVALQLGISDPE